jgi:hypothetical protein
MCGSGGLRYFQHRGSADLYHTPPTNGETNMGARALLATTAAAGMLLTAPAPAFAQSNYSYNGPNAVSGDAYCQTQRQNRMMIGGAIGAIAGAVLGNNLAARGRQSEGSVLGGVAGAATGAVIGRNSGPCSPAQQRNTTGRPYGYNQGSPPPPYQGPREPDYRGRGYNNGDYPLEGGPRQPAYDRGYERGDDRYERGYERSNGVCDYKNVQGQSIYMCRGGDGVWRPA